MVIVTVTLTWAMFKWFGLPLFMLGVIALFAGSLPDNDRKPLGDLMRWITWPSFLIWLIIIIGRGLFV